ncbi:MAG: OB-fold domain-containing protein [Alphaproteobacteria bacterium]|nr:OB-fold domain-containing protein [Alphaproteobacteria bacterium]
MAAPAAELKPVVKFLKRHADGRPYLEGHKCEACGTVFIGERSVCSKCFARDRIRAVELPNRGTLYAYSIIHRSYPGVEVPFVSAVVDVEGGGTLKGNLMGVKPDPKTIEMGMPVEIVYGDAGRTDAEGHHYLAYFFKPAAR